MFLTIINDQKPFIKNKKHRYFFFFPKSSLSKNFCKFRKPSKMGSHAASLIHNSSYRIEFYINQIGNNTHESPITLSVTHLITVQTFTKFHLPFFLSIYKREMDDSEDIFSAFSHVISLFFQFFSYLFRTNNRQVSYCQGASFRAVTSLQRTSDKHNNRKPSSGRGATEWTLNVSYG